MRPKAPAARPAATPAAKPAPKTAAPAARPSPPAPETAAKAPKPHGPRPPRKSGRKSPLSQRRGPGGEPFVPGDLLLPGGPMGGDEVQYLFRGCVAAEHPAGDLGIAEVFLKRGVPEPEGERSELQRQVEALAKRFEGGSVEPMLPARPQAPRRNFQGVVERAKYRRREIGAFLRGLDVGRTETSHMDSHGEASLQSLMEWAARLENLAEADEPDQADYAQFHRGLDQLENTTEALMIDVELTLRRLRDRIRAS